MSPEQQADILLALLRGGSPQAACQKLGADPQGFCRTTERDEAFRTRLRHVRELMTLNVVATVYRAALEGAPAAQALWLRTFSPPDWTASTSISSNASLETNDEFASLPTDALRRILAAFHGEFSTWFSSDEAAEPA